MRSSRKRVLITLFLIGHVIALPNEQLDEQDDEYFDEEIEKIMNEGRKKHGIVTTETPELESTTKNYEKFNLKAERDEFETKLKSFFNATQAETEQLNAVLTESFNDIGRRLATKTQSTAKNCGEDKECVDPWMCKNSTKTDDGTFPITFRSLYNEDDCSYDQICCHISDKIEQPPEKLLPSSMAKCGYRNPNGILLTIEGGRHNEANYGEFPWMIAIMMRELTPAAELLRYLGGGSLLAPNVVLTAAHKFNNVTANELLARAGDWDRTSDREFYRHQNLDVQQIIKHPNFRGTMSNNIALLLLKGSFDPSPHISPICLPSANANFDNERCIVTGWGKRSITSTNYPHILKEISVPIVPRSRCNELIRQKAGSRFVLAASDICAGGEKDIDSCHGDGGAPLVCPIKDQPNRYYQAGLVSWGIKCGLENVPSGYTSVAHMVPWITQELYKLQIDSTYYTA